MTCSRGSILLKDTKNNTKICKAFDEGYVCPNKKPVYIENFTSIFIPESLTTDVYIDMGTYKECNQLKNGYYCSDEELPVLDIYLLEWLLIGRSKGIIIKSDDGTEKICKVEKNGSYVCGNEEQYFNPIIPFGTWKFYESSWHKQEGITCTGYTNGYVCSDNNKPFYINNFRSYFDFAISYGEGYENFGKSKMPTIVLESEKDIWNRKSFDGKLITDKENKQKICRLFGFDNYVQSGYVCKGETPVVLKNRPKMTPSKNTWSYYVPCIDIFTDNLTDLTCKRDDNYYYCPGETRKRVPIDTNTPREYAEIQTDSGYQKFIIKRSPYDNTIRLEKRF